MRNRAKKKLPSPMFGYVDGGQKGVERALTLLRAEVERSMALAGCASIAEIKPEMLIKR